MKKFKNIFKKIAIVAVIGSAMPIHAMDGLLKVPQAQSTADICRGLASQYPVTSAVAGGAAAAYGGYKLYNNYSKEINSFMRTLQKHKSSLAIFAIALAPRITFLQNKVNALADVLLKQYPDQKHRYQYIDLLFTKIFIGTNILLATPFLMEIIQILRDPTILFINKLRHLAVTLVVIPYVTSLGSIRLISRVLCLAFLLERPETAKCMLVILVVSMQKQLNQLIRTLIANKENPTLLKMLITLNGIETDLHTDALSLPRSKAEFLEQIKKLLPDRTQIPITPLLFSLLTNNKQLALWIHKHQAALKPLEQSLLLPDITPQDKKDINDFLAMLTTQKCLRAGLTSRIPVELIEHAAQY